ncbi:HAMP domain-containing methyl-accepting chemotaxis protein [Azospirillum sp. sgz302134]
MAAPVSSPTSFSFLANLRIRAKVLSGFICVLMILLAVSTVGFTAFLKAKTAFKGFGDRVTVVEIARDIDRNVLDLRRKASEYTQSGSEDARAAAKDVIALLRRNIQDGLSQIEDPERLDRLKAVQASFEQYAKSFDQVVALKRDEAALVKDSFDPLSKRMRFDLETLVAAAGKARDRDVADMAQTGQQTVMQARLYATVMMVRQDEEAAQQADQYFKELQSLMRALDALSGDTPYRAEYDTVATGTERYYDSFKRARELSRQISQTVNQSMKAAGDSISRNIAEIKDSAIADEHAIKADAEATLESSEQLMIVLTVGGLVVGMLLAWVIGSGISTPVIGMTEAMKRIAGGDLSAPVPSLGRRDEVGEMADTLEVFKRGMVEAERLRAEQEEAKRRAEEARKQDMNRLADEFESQVEGVVQHVASASAEMTSTASTMSAAADQAKRQATTVAAAAEQASVNVQTVAAAAGQLRESIREIGRQIARSTETTQAAVLKAEHTNGIVGSLAQAAQKIGDVVALINDIAGQTNLLALNATIEAARAGEAGKGFAVVASEVKSLANQTGKATEEIAQQISAVQDATRQAVEAIRDITDTITSVNETSSSIASAVEEQQAATGEISRNVEEAARGTQEVASNIVGVSDAAHEAASAAEQVLTEASELSRQSDLLDKEVVAFIAKVRAS